MIERMDKAMLSLQAAATARKLYGLDHAVVKRQVDQAMELFDGMLSERRELRVVRLDTSLLFDDAELPSNPFLAEVLTPRLAAHRIEWLEFRPGLARPELVTLLDQLERQPAELLRHHRNHPDVKPAWRQWTWSKRWWVALLFVNIGTPRGRAA